MITVVMLNWRRPSLLNRNVLHYANYTSVSRVICFNNGASLRHVRWPENCVLIESSQDLGLYSRLAAGALARTEAILHTDDDLLLPEESVVRLFDAWRNAPGSCHGLFGRAVDPHYTGAPASGRVEVVLTRAVMCSRAINNLALEMTSGFDDLRGDPDGNGEDIILSYAAIKASGKLNYVYDLDALEDTMASTESVGPEAVSIHLRVPNHHSHRTLVVERAKALLGAVSRRGS